MSHLLNSSLNFHFFQLKVNSVQRSTPPHPICIQISWVYTPLFRFSFFTMITSSNHNTNYHYIVPSSELDTRCFDVYLFEMSILNCVILSILIVCFFKMNTPVINIKISFLESRRSFLVVSLHRLPPNTCNRTAFLLMDLHWKCPDRSLLGLSRYFITVRNPDL